MSNDPINPNHYKTLFRLKENECIRVSRCLDFDLGNYFKYLWRLFRKGDAAKATEDFDKACWYMEDWIQNHKPCISLRYLWSPRFSLWARRKDDRNLTIKNDCSEKAKVAFDFIQEPNPSEGELYDRYHLLSIATDLYISPYYWRDKMKEYKAKYIDKELQ